MFASTGRQDVASASLDVTPLPAGPGGLAVEVTSDTSARPSLCFTSPQQAVRLTISSGGYNFGFDFTGNETGASCNPVGGGLPVLVGSAGSGLQHAIEFDGIAYLQLHAQAPAGILYGFAGQLVLNPGQTTVPGSTTLLCSAADPCPLSATFNADTQSQSLVVSSTAAASVVSNGGQLVPSAWAQNADILVPVYGFFFTVAVVPLLGAVVQVLISALLGWTGPRRRRDRGAAKAS